MNEDELRQQIKVIGAGLVYHWRSGDGTRMCGTPGTEPVMPLTEARAHNLGVCHACQRVAEAMAKGWK